MARGPERLTDALILTFDNLGEASELERGTWPKERPVGAHSSVTEALPRLLDELEASKLTATFFVEAINCQLYPDSLLEIARRGHEIGMHGWRHEPWSELAPLRQRDLLARGLTAFRSLGLDVTGFRPPGGNLEKDSAQRLLSAGIKWCSPAGGDMAVHGGLAYVPFEWELVDAYYLLEGFAPRNSRGEPRLDPGGAASRIAAQIESGGFPRTLILHPFLTLDERWFAAVRDLLALARERATWVGPGGEFANRLDGV